MLRSYTRAFGTVQGSAALYHNYCSGPERSLISGRFLVTGALRACEIFSGANYVACVLLAMLDLLLSSLLQLNRPNNGKSLAKLLALLGGRLLHGHCMALPNSASKTNNGPPALETPSLTSPEVSAPVEKARQTTG